MSKTGLWIIAGVAIASLLYLVYLSMTLDAPTGTTTVVIQPPVTQSVAVEPEPVSRQISLPQNQLQPEPTPPPVATLDVVIASPPVAVEIEPEPEPVIEASDVPVVRLPTLNDSDQFVFSGLQNLSNAAALVPLLASEQLIRKLVVFVDNISRGEFPQTGLPYLSMEQEMQVRTIDENLFEIDEVAYSRFDLVTDIFVAIDTEQAMSFYRVLYPLFQQAYAEIGFRDVNFDDTLRRAITNVLSTADVEGPFQLVKPSVMYLYADASIENLQEVHKQLIRIGPENTEQLKAKLRQILIQL
jgi:hypothetical protein